MDDYVKQCDCPEIQDNWQPKVGDKAKLKYYRTGFIGYITSVREHAAFNLLIDLEQGYGNQFQSELIFLPSIEQLMGMVEHANWTVKLDMFRKWFIKTNNPEFQTEQEARLAFVMHELYNKRWENEKWM